MIQLWWVKYISKEVMVLTSLHRMPFKPAIFLFNRRLADVLTCIPFFASFAGSRVNTPHVAVTLCRMTCIHASVSRSPRGHGSVAPDNRHCRQWMSSPICGFLPNALYLRPVPLTYQPRICKDGFISIVFDVSPVCCLFDRVRVDNRPLLRSLPMV